MRVGCESITWPIVLRPASAILLLGVITSGLAIAQVSEGDCHTVALRNVRHRQRPFHRVYVRCPRISSSPTWSGRLASMSSQSPTFRRQCARLAEHHGVTVRIELAIGCDTGGAIACGAGPRRP